MPCSSTLSPDHCRKMAYAHLNFSCNIFLLIFKLMSSLGLLWNRKYDSSFQVAKYSYSIQNAALKMGSSLRVNFNITDNFSTYAKYHSNNYQRNSLNVSCDDVCEKYFCTPVFIFLFVLNSQRPNFIQGQSFKLYFIPFLGPIPPTVLTGDSLGL